MTQSADQVRTTGIGSDWRAVAGFPDYSVSRFGDILSHRAGRSLSPYFMKGYPSVSLHGQAGRKIMRVHSVVAAAFHGPRPLGRQCAHLDGDKTNNAASNLAWVTKAENEAHKLRHGTANVGERSPHAKLTNERAELIRLAARRPLTRREIAALVGVSDNIVEGILDRRTYVPK